MFNLKEITVKDFFNLKEEEALKYLRLQSMLLANDVFLNRKAKPLGRLKFGEVATLKRLFTNPSLKNLENAFKMVYKCDRYQFYNANFISFSYALKGLQKNLEALIKRELLLKTDTDPLLDLAGVKKLNVFKEMGTLISLAERYSKSPEEIENWSYNIVFTILLYDSKKAEVEKEYNKLKTKQK